MDRAIHISYNRIFGIFFTSEDMENVSLCIFRYLTEINASIFVILSTAFLRRGMAYKALKNQELAVEDFESMLKIDPNNKRAKVLSSLIFSLLTYFCCLFQFQI
jgi:tetratricopeptide (TPR) repeat protein